MKNSKHLILRSAAALVIIISALFFTYMLAGALRLPQTFSSVFHETYEVLGGFDVYLNGKLIAKDVSGSFIGKDTGNFFDEYVLKARIENVNTSYSDPTLCFRSYSSAVDVYQDGRKIFSLADQNPIGESASFSGGRYNFASLADDYAGSEIEIRYDDGETERYYLLGAWDGDPERRFLAYRTRLGQAVLNRKVGSEIEAGNRKGVLAAVRPLPEEIIAELDE